MLAKYTSTAEAAERNGVSVRYMQQLCQRGKVKGAQQFGGAWMVPAGFRWKAQKPGPKPKK